MDIGWHGNMQRSFATLLRADATRRNLPVTGFILVCQASPRDGAGSLRRLLPESRPEREALRSLNVTLLEMMAAADHGMVLGYRADGGAIKPILDGARNEAALAWGWKCCKGALQFATTGLGFGALAPEDRAQFQSLSRQCS